VTGRNAKETWQQNIFESAGKKIVLVFPAVMGRQILQRIVVVLKHWRLMQAFCRMMPVLYDYSAVEYQKERWRH